MSDFRAQVPPEVQAAIDAEAAKMNGAGDPDDFKLVWGDRRNIRRTRWLDRGRLKLSALNCVYASGGTGRSTVARWFIAQATRGKLAGDYEEDPVNVLYIGDEDTFAESTLPAVVAMDGDEQRVATLNYEAGRAPDFTRDIQTIEAIITEHGIRFIYVDHVLDHIGSREKINTHAQHDIRDVLAPLRALATRHEVAVLYGGHVNKGHGGSLRDRAGGSGQFVDLARSGLLVGYPPNSDGSERALARGKGNFGAVPPVLRFRITGRLVPNPANPEEVADIGVIEDVHEDDELDAEDLSTSPPQKQEPSKEDRAVADIEGIGADGKWRTRRETEEWVCANTGVTPRTFTDAFARVAKETRPKGREIEWRLSDS